MGKYRRRIRYLRIMLLIQYDDKPDGRERAEEVSLERLDEWYNEHLYPPYPDGTLVKYTIDPSPEVVTINRLFSTHLHERTKTE